MFETTKVMSLKATSNLCVEFSCWFPNAEIMIALGMVYHIVGYEKKKLLRTSSPIWIKLKVAFCVDKKIRGGRGYDHTS